MLVVPAPVIQPDLLSSGFIVCKNRFAGFYPFPVTGHKPLIPKQYLSSQVSLSGNKIFEKGMCTGIKNMGFGPKEAGYQPPSIFIGSKEIRGICTKREKTTIKNDIDMRFTAIDTSAWEELKKLLRVL